MAEMIREFPSPISVNTSPGVTPGVIFSRPGTITTGGYLEAGTVVSSNCGFPIFGKNKIVRVRATNASNVGTNTVIRFQIRTGLATFSDLPDSDITILAGSYFAVKEMSVSLPTDPELACYLVSGSNLSNVIVNCFLYPDYS